METPIIQQILSRIAIINEEMGGLQQAQTQIAVDVAVLKSQMANLMFWFKGIMGAFIIFFVTQFWQVAILRRNNKKNNNKQPVYNPLK